MTIRATPRTPEFRAAMPHEIASQITAHYRRIVEK
jgi:hypothetical protein